jgi:hypothetical protein
MSNRSRVIGSRCPAKAGHEAKSRARSFHVDPASYAAFERAPPTSPVRSAPSGGAEGGLAAPPQRPSSIGASNAVL